VTKASAGVLVTVGVTLKVRVVFGTVVVGQLENTFPVESVLCLLLGGEAFFLLLGESQEVQRLVQGMV
jgi:hypothetical protein